MTSSFWGKFPGGIPPLSASQLNKRQENDKNKQTMTILTKAI